MAPQKLLDLAGVRDRLDGDDELVAELARHFLERGPAQLAAVEAAAGRGDPKALQFAAHTFKSTLAIFGAAPAVALAQSLEDLGQAGRVDGAAAACADLVTSARQLELEVAAEILGRTS